jgi:hypothetical protein
MGFIVCNIKIRNKYSPEKFIQYQTERIYFPVSLHFGLRPNQTFYTSKFLHLSTNDCNKRNGSSLNDARLCEILRSEGGDNEYRSLPAHDAVSIGK